MEDAPSVNVRRGEPRARSRGREVRANTHHTVLLVRPHKLHVRPGRWRRLWRHLHLLRACTPLLQQCICLLLMRWLCCQRSWRRLLWLLCWPTWLLLRWPARLLLGVVPAMLLLLQQPAVCSCYGQQKCHNK